MVIAGKGLGRTGRTRKIPERPVQAEEWESDQENPLLDDVWLEDYLHQSDHGWNPTIPTEGIDTDHNSSDEETYRFHS